MAPEKTSSQQSAISTRMKWSIHVIVTIALLLSVNRALAEEQPQAEKRYLAFKVFDAWRSLVPELKKAMLCHLTERGHELWREDQLRLPDPSLVGDFNHDGIEDRAIRLRVGSDESPCEYVLSVTRNQSTWSWLHLQRLEYDDNARGDLLWIPERLAIGIDSGQRKRFTKPATMSWSPTRGGSSEAGYVIEAKLVSHFIRWNPELSRFDYEHVSVPEEIFEPDELELLRRDGLVP